MRFLLAPLLLVLTACASPSGSRGGHESPATAAADGESSVRPGHAPEWRTVFSPPPMLPPSEMRTARGTPGPAYWQQRCDYRIEASLDAEARRITARATVTYTNNSPEELPFLWLTLEQNLFTHDSDGALLTPPSARFGNRDHFSGGFEIASVSVGGQPASLKVYDTVGRLDLPTPVPARGGTVSFDITWAFDLPPYGSDRLGVFEAKAGPVFQVAQWYPAVCKLDDVHGWNTLPYLGQGEFYTDFGDFDVAITVPSDHLVAGGGVLVNPDEVLTGTQLQRLAAARSSPDTVYIHGPDDAPAAARRSEANGAATRTWRFRAENTRSFAFASSAAFIWDACFLEGPGPGSNGNPDLGQGVLCQSFYPREALPVWGKDAPGGGSTQMLRESIEHYSRRWYAYPYPSASNVNGVVGGMEYPMIIFCGGGRGDQQPVDAERGLWGVTTHEIGHNWFPMLVNTDERRHAWMDEGFDTFINYYATLERYPHQLPFRGHPRAWAHDNAHPALQPIDLPADQLAAGTLGKQQYGKASVGLVLLREGILGPERFDAAFREYIRRWAFKSPRPGDFFRTMEDVAGMDLSWFWRGWFYSTGVLDQGVTTVMQPSGEGRNARVTFVNLGELVMPLTYRVTYTDGSTETRRLPVQAWFTTDKWQTTWDTGGRRIREILIDPDEHLPDVNLSNNRWSR